MVKVSTYQAQRGITSKAPAVRLNPDAMTVSAGAVVDFADTATKVVGDVVERKRQADDVAWVSKTTAQAQMDWAQQMQDEQRQAAEGADGFAGAVNKKFETYRDQALKGAPTPNAERLARLRFDMMGRSLFDQALNFEAKAGRAKRLTDFNLGVDGLANTAFSNPGREGELLEQLRGDLIAAENTWMLPTDVTAMRAKAPGMIAEAAMRGRIGQDPHTALAALIGNEDGEVFDPTALRIGADRRPVLISAARSEINRRRVAFGTQTTGLKQRLGEMSKVIEAGFDPGEDAFNGLSADIAALGTSEHVQGSGADERDVKTAQELAAHVTALRGQLAFQSEIRTWTPKMLQTWLNGEQGRLHVDGATGDGVSSGEASRVTLAAKVLTNMNREIQQDPISWAAKTGVAKIEPVAFSGDGALESMLARRATALGLADYYGVPARFLTDEEEYQLKTVVQSGTADQQTALAFALTSGFGDRASDVFQRIAPDDPLFAHAGGLAMMGQAHTATAREVLAGRSAMNAGNKVLPPNSDMQTWTSAKMGGALSNLPSTRAAVIEAAAAIYTARALTKGKLEDHMWGNGDAQNIWEASLMAAAGGTKGTDGQWRGGFGTFNGREIILPPGVTESEFQDLMYAAEDVDFGPLGAPVHGDGKAFKISDIPDAELIDYGPGQYLVDMSGDGSGLIRGDGPNGYFVLDVGRLGLVMQARLQGVEVSSLTEQQAGAVDPGAAPDQHQQPNEGVQP